MSIRSALYRAQVAADARMADTCVIRRDAMTTNPTTGAAVHSYTTVYSGPCELQESGSQGSRGESAEAPVMVGRRIVKVPAATVGVNVGDEVTIGTRTFRVADTHGKTWQSAQRIPVDEVL